MDGNALQLTLREMRQHLGDVRALGTMAVVGIVLGLAGPFGSFAALELLPRIAYWVATVFLTYGFGYSLSMYADAAWGGGRPLWLRLPLMAVPAGLAATLTVTLINLTVFGTKAFDWPSVLLLLLQCLAVAFGVVTVVLLLERRAPEANALPAGPAPILERVPPAQRGLLLALSVEDHYVDIITERGKTLVLMRLADAIKETAGVEGLQIHRSHWVAKAAVTKIHRAEGKVALELSNGLKLPVSRGFLPQLRAAGIGA